MGGRRRECLEKCGLGLANCKMLEINNLSCFAWPTVWLALPFPSIYMPFSDSTHRTVLVWVLAGWLFGKVTTCELVGPLHVKA